jgi:hypothetical protein
LPSFDLLQRWADTAACWPYYLLLLLLLLFDPCRGHSHGHSHGWGWGRRKVLAELAPANNNDNNTVSNKVEAAAKAPHAAAKHAAATKPTAAAVKAGKESAKQFPHYDYYAPSVVVSMRVC